jgi:uncharacterized alkaline shock family protein YloU
MTRFLHGLSATAIWILFAASGGALIYANTLAIEEGILNRFLWESSRFQGAVVGGVVVLLALLNLVTLTRRCPRMRFISFESEDGTVSISVNAVRDFIRKLGEEFSAVISLEPKLSAHKKGINIDLGVKVESGSRIPELSHILQNRVRESIRNGLGITEVDEIKVRIQEIVGAPPPARDYE